MKTTYKKLLEFNQIASAFVASEKEETKLKNFVEDAIDAIKDEVTAFNSRLTKKRRKHAAEDNWGAILRDERGNYRYTKDGEEALEAEIEEDLNREVDIELDGYFSPVPETLPKGLVKAFTGFVFEGKNETADEAEKLMKTINKKQ